MTPNPTDRLPERGTGLQGAFTQVRNHPLYLQLQVLQVLELEHQVLEVLDLPGPLPGQLSFWFPSRRRRRSAPFMDWIRRDLDGNPALEDLFGNRIPPLRSWPKPPWRSSDPPFGPL